MKVVIIYHKIDAFLVTSQIRLISYLVVYQNRYENIPISSNPQKSVTACSWRLDFGTALTITI